MVWARWRNAVAREDLKQKPSAHHSPTAFSYRVRGAWALFLDVITEAEAVVAQDLLRLWLEAEVG